MSRRTAHRARLRGALLLALGGLGSVAASGCNSGGSGMPAAPVNTPTSALLADSNRDGVVDDKDAKVARTWGPGAGALFLANVDDDDSDGNADATDDVVNGDEDDKDLARLRVAPWAKATATATGTLTLDRPVEGQSVNLFRKDGAGWRAVTSPVALSSADLVSGVELGIEARDFAQTTDPKGWDGRVRLHLVVKDPADSAAMAKEGVIVEDAVDLRVAPFVMVNNLSPVFQVWNAYVPDKGGRAFRADLGLLGTAAKAEVQDAEGNGDVWDEDWWQIGITFMPAAGGAHGMRVGQRSAQPDRVAGEWAEQQLGPDFGFTWPHTESDNGQPDAKAYSLDSFGNHDTLPPYTLGKESYPFGRIIVGGSKAANIDSVVRKFYDAQAVQPVIVADTTWLLVGHIDEIVSYVPAKTPRGWKLLVASARLARTMLQDLSQQGHGADIMFSGKSWVDFQTSKLIPAAISVDKLLADKEVMAASETAQQKVDAAVAIIREAAGLTDDEIIEMPFLFERIRTNDTGAVAGYEHVAHMVGTVNLRAANGVVGIPKPHGAVINGADVFEQDLRDRLGTSKLGLGADGMGLPIQFVEDWDDYHVFDGEVHCGTTVGVTTFPTTPWWEAGR